MILNYLLKPWIKKNVPNINILNITLNSKDSKSGSLFFSINGYSENGNKYIKESIKLGSIAVIVDIKDINYHGKIVNIKFIPIIFFYKLNFFLSEISNRFYYHISNKLKLIGITGTNGKTTISYISSQLINLIDKNKSAIIGTLGNGIIPNLIETSNTTDSPIKIQKTLYEFYKKNIKIVFIEVSSHSICQFRIKSLKFKCVVFTNVSHEHLDFHKNMFNYKSSKYKFLSEYKSKNCIINIDNKFGNKIHKHLKCIPVSIFKEINIKSKLIKLIIKNIKFIKYKSYIEILINNNNINFELNFIGYFNINNFIISFVILINLGYNFDIILKFSSFIKLPPGRMEVIKYNNKDIIIDYAHTPDAMNNILLTINKICVGNIWCIFGCGGNKDVLKRSIIGKIASIYSYKIILTSDNPRNENIYNIINDIKKGINNSYKNVLCIVDRKKAIEFSIINSNKNDIILILGKGHEKFQIFNKNIKINYSDKKIVLDFIKNDKLYIK